jgi:hypothetical protein
MCQPAGQPDGPLEGLPDGARLRQLEQRARRDGSDLQARSLQGRWRFTRVWARQSEAAQATASALLRSLAATLEIGPPDAAGDLPMANAVALPGLELRFEGRGRLRGRRPLLSFWFDRWRLSVAGVRLIERSLAAPPELRRLPFFALIGRGTSLQGQAWLAARGRGGGLALWLLDPGSASPGAR